MKVQFEFTLAEVARRAVNRSPLVHRWRLMNSLAAAVLVGLLMLFATPWDLTIRGAVAASIVVVVFVLIFSLGRRRIYRPIGSLLVRDRAFADQQVRTEFLSLARRRIPAGTQEQAAPKVAQETLVAGPTEGDYFVAWLLFFLCVSISSSVVSSGVGAGTAAILRTSDSSPAPVVYVIAVASFLLTACLSFFFFRLFSKRLVSRVQAQRTLAAT